MNDSTQNDPKYTDKTDNNIFQVNSSIDEKQIENSFSELNADKNINANITEENVEVSDLPIKRERGRTMSSVSKIKEPEKTPEIDGAEKKIEPKIVMIENNEEIEDYGLQRRKRGETAQSSRRKQDVLVYK